MSNTPYSIRAVQLAEIDSALRLIRETPGFDVSFYNARSLREQWESVLTAGSRDQCQGVSGAFFHNADLKGMARFLIHHGKDKGRIVDFGVHPDHQGKGIGHDLLKHVLAQMKERGCSTVSLGVQWTNKSARAFYRAQGGNETLPDLRHTMYAQYEWNL